MSEHSEQAIQLFKQGYNCCQAVFAAFCDETGLDMDTALKLSSSFGAGMSRLREVCGAVSGMFMVAGMKRGYADAKDTNAKTELYKLNQSLAKKFNEENGSILCRELLGLGDFPTSHIPEPRTDAYYSKRPCIELVRSAAEIIDEMLSE